MKKMSQNGVTEKKYLIENGKEFFTPLGALPSEATVRFSIFLGGNASAETAVLRIHADADGEMRLFPMEKDGANGGDRFDAVVPMETILRGACDGLYYYCYDVYYQSGCVTYGGESPRDLCPCGEDGKRQLLLYRRTHPVPSWLCGGILYHIFVDRFYPSGKSRPKAGTFINPNWENGVPQFAPYPGAPLANNEFFGGDLYGIAKKMEYIASLGVTCLYLSPIFDAASNHKYDTGDYSKIDEMFGGEEGLDALLTAARAHGIRVILDGVFNHTGADSVYFNKFSHYDSIGAFQSKDSPFYPWYSFQSYPDKYDAWWGIPILPKVRCDDPSYREYILGEEGIVVKWTRRGVSGWRLDVADELSDDFLEALHTRLQGINPDAVIYGEVWEDATNKIAYGSRRRYFRGGQLHSVMNYPLRDAVISYVRDGDSEKFCTVVEGIYRRYPQDAANLLMNFLGTHDTMRILTALAGDSPDGHTNRELSEKRLSPEQRAHGLRLLALAYALVSVMPGVPCIFYGDEAGVEGYGDPFCRMPFPWGREDQTLLARYRAIGALHHAEPVLRNGAMRILHADVDSVAVVRENGKDPAVLLLLNRSAQAISFSVTATACGIDTEYIGNTPILSPLTACHYHVPDGVSARRMHP